MKIDFVSRHENPIQEITRGSLDLNLNRLASTVNLSYLVTFSPSSTTSKSLILSLGFRKFRPQNGRSLLKLTVSLSLVLSGDPYGISHVKFAASLVDPMPVHFATRGYAQTGRVMSTWLPRTRYAVMLLGSSPDSRQRSMALK